MQAVLAIEAQESERAAFIRKTYGHLAGALLAFTLLETFLLKLPIAETFTQYAGNRFVWLGILLAFMVVSSIAERWAQSSVSRNTQYLGLGLYVVVEAIIFVPLLMIAGMVSKDIIPTAAILTGALTLGLTGVCVTTRANFSGLRSWLVCGSFIALGLIVCSAIFGFDLGLIFSAAMILLAAGAILYTTSRIQRDYTTDQYVAASLSLFAAVALLFWYVVRLLISIYGRRN
jgi:FtsH-binding integral membrane protein